MPRRRAAGAGGEAEEFEKFGEGLVAFLDAGGEFFALGGEGEAAVGDVVEVTELGQALDREGDGGGADVELLGDAADADKTPGGRRCRRWPRAAVLSMLSVAPPR